MKRLILSIAVLLLAVSVQAEERVVFGGKADAPRLVKITKDLTIGVEGGKELANGFFSSYLEDDKGYFGYIKVTYWGSLFDLTKK